MPADESSPGPGRSGETGTVSEADVAAALEALSAPGRLREAEQRIAGVAPQLQRILAAALEEGGWFDEAHRSQVLKAATTPDPDERIAAVRTLIAEETRVAMLIGATVGWELAAELERAGRARPAADADPGEAPQGGGPAPDGPGRGAAPDGPPRADAAGD